MCEGMGNREWGRGQGGRGIGIKSPLYPYTLTPLNPA